MIRAISSGLCPGTCVVPSRSVSSDLDTLTPLLELYVRLRERRLVLVVGGTDTSSRHWSPASPSPVPHSSEPRPGSLEVPGMGMRPCGSQVVFTAFVPVFLVCSVLGEFPTEPVTSEAHPYPPQVRAKRTFLGRRPIRSCVVAVQGQHLQQCSVASVASCLLPSVVPRGMPQALKFEMADRRDWGGGGDDPEESTQRMIERIWESLTDIRRRMDQQAPVPPVVVPPGDGETVPIAPIPPGVEVPFVAPLPPPSPVLIAKEPVMQVEKFLRLQSPTYLEGSNPDIAEHWVHEIERVFTTMRCPATDKVVLAAYQLRGFALEWWRLKMQTTFAGRTEEAIAWSEFLDNAIVPHMCKTVEEAAQRAVTLERSIRTRQVGESDSGSSRLPQQSVGVSKGKAPVGPSPSGFGKWGQKLKQAFKGKGRGWGGRQQF
ncbi:hypothetical protein Taro_008676 [Colocasia esculenta]|uniref:Gag protein n=1 Tax=Colocasia esculenta TaxID=4460 RepID=A0A843TUB7_COLES|nr:hypothetical protein [Colocasia esculenta]